MTKRGPVLPPTQVLQPLYVVGSDKERVDKQRELDRKAGVEKRRAQGRLSDAAQTAIDELLHRHPNASSHRIAELMQGDSATAVLRLGKRGKPVLKDGKPVLMTAAHLARKITRYRPRAKTVGDGVRPLSSRPR